MKINNIYNIDCNKGMNKMIKENLKVDLIIADPPYVISKKSQFHTMKDRKNPRKGTDFGEWDKEFNNKPWIKKSYELLNKGGSLLVFNDFKKATEIINYAQNLGFVYKDTLIWKKTNPMPRNRDRRYVPDIEASLTKQLVISPCTVTAASAPTNLPPVTFTFSKPTFSIVPPSTAPNKPT